MMEIREGVVDEAVGAIDNSLVLAGGDATTSGSDNGGTSGNAAESSTDCRDKSAPAGRNGTLTAAPLAAKSTGSGGDDWCSAGSRASFEG